MGSVRESRGRMKGERLECLVAAPKALECGKNILPDRVIWVDGVRAWVHGGVVCGVWD